MAPIKHQLSHGCGWLSHSNAHVWPLAFVSLSVLPINSMASSSEPSCLQWKFPEFGSRLCSQLINIPQRVKLLSAKCTLSSTVYSVLITCNPLLRTDWMAEQRNQHVLWPQRTVQPPGKKTKWNAQSWMRAWRKNGLILLGRGQDKFTENLDELGLNHG